MKNSNNKYLLGVDGGAGSTKFLVTDLDLSEVMRFDINKGSNPWHNGVEQTKSILREGFERIDKEIGDEIVQVYLGISGCFGDSKYNEKIISFANSYFNNINLGGDLYSSFRSLSDKKEGILAIAGSGSSVANFGKEKTNFFDGPAFGARDFGYLFTKLLIDGNLDKHIKLKEFIKEHLVLSKIRKECVVNWVKDKRVLSLSKVFSELNQNDKIFQEAEQLLRIVIDRWVYKLCAYIIKYDYSESDEFDVVFSGGFWGFDYIRKEVVSQVQSEFTNAKILYAKDSEPVLGCVKIARERVS